MKAIMNLMIVSASAFLVACTSGGMNQYASNNANQNVLGAGTVPGVAIGGGVARSMDSFDRVKLTRALDKAPGKSTDWVNANTGIQYTVTPIQKVTVNGNPYCRQYQIIYGKGGNKQQMMGTACVASDGAWSEVS